MSEQPQDQTTDAWLATLDPAAAEVTHDGALAALDAVREAPTTRHAWPRNPTH